MLTNSYVVGERGLHHRVWQKLTIYQDAQGQTVTQTNSAYTKLASGISYLKNGQWVDSVEEFQITPDGQRLRVVQLHPRGLTCAWAYDAPNKLYTLNVTNPVEHRPGKRHRVGQVELPQLVFVGAPAPFAEALRHVRHSSARAVVGPTLANCT